MFVLGLYMIYSLGPIFWLVLSSFKSRQDLFTMPPKLIFTPDFSGYQAVFGIGAAKDTAAAVGLSASLFNSIIVSTAGTVLRNAVRHPCRLCCLAVQVLGSG